MVRKLSNWICQRDRRELWLLGNRFQGHEWTQGAGGGGYCRSPSRSHGDVDLGSGAGDGEKAKSLQKEHGQWLQVF